MNQSDQIHKQTIQGLCTPMMINDIDTDIIIPAQHLTQISRSGYGQHAFARLKQADPEFVLNQSKYKPAKIMIVGENFGCGSSREHAVWAIQELGYEAIIAPSFADIFSNNARKNGLVLITQTMHQCQSLAASASDTELYIKVDLLNAQFSAVGQIHNFVINPFFQHCITQGKDEMDYLMSHQKAINSHHQQIMGAQLFIDCSGTESVGVKP